MSDQAFRQLISGETRGCAAACARFGLLALTLPYRAIVTMRNAAFDREWKNVRRVNAPVVAIGNLTTGGTGKTPVVAMVAHVLLEAGFQPGIVSRGYRADSSGTNDEKRVLDRLCPAVPHEQDPDRVAAASKLIRTENVNAIVLDDAFQHRRIHRDLNILLIDATCPFGYGHLLPRGLLREPLAAIKRADAVLVTRSNLADQKSLQEIEAAVRQHNADLADSTFRVSFRSVSLLTATGESLDLSTIDGQRVVVATAIGNPASFLQTCEELGAAVTASRFFADHHCYSDGDVAEILQLARTNECERVLVTLKDLVKLPATASAFAAVQIETVFDRPGDHAVFRQVVDSAISPRLIKSE